MNYGRGCKPLSWGKAGNDLIVTFDAAGSGITPKEFAPKLLGKNKKGEFVIGYARLPYINYTPAILSALPPVYNPADKQLKIEVQNFGLSASEKTVMRVKHGWHIIAEAEVKPLKP